MKILHTGDWHISIMATRLGRVRPNNEVHKNRVKILNHIVQTALDEEVDYVVVPGDIFDKATPYPMDYWELIQILDPLYVYEIPVILLCGNHDENTTKGSGLHPLQGRGYFVGLELEAQPIDDTHFIIAPWGSRLEDIAELSTKDSIILLHAGIKTEQFKWVELEGEDTNFHLNDLLALDYKAIMLNHFHSQAQLAPNIWYSGSPDNVHGFSEEKDIKGFLIWEINGKDVKVTQHSTKGLYPEYKTFTPKEFLAYPEKGIEAYVRVKGEVSEQERLDIIKKMKEFECLDYIYDLSSKTKNKVIAKIEGKSDTDILTNYLKSKNVKNIDELVKLDKELT